MNVELEKAGLDRLQKIIKIARIDPSYSRESESINDVIDKIITSGHRKIPVVSGEGLVGIVAITDILDSFLRKQDFNEKISAIMARDVIFCNANDAVGFVLQKFKLSRRGSFPVMQDKKLIGMVSERDFVKHFSNVDFGVTVEEVMTKRPFYLNSSVSVLDCLKSMVNTKYRRLPIVKDKKLMGIVTSIDVLKYITKKGVSIDQPVDYMMIKDVVSVLKEKDVSHAIKLMKGKDIGGICVVDKNLNIEGVITERDILEQIV